MSHEVALNVRLCDILVNSGIDAEEEDTQADGSRIDIRCRVGSHVVAIEAEHGYSKAKMREAIKDADAKLKRQVCDMAIALVYPGSHRTKHDLEHGDIRASIRAPGRQPKAEHATWRQVKVADFADFVIQAPNELGSPEALAKRADIAIKKAAAKFSTSESHSIIAEMGDAARGTNINGLMTDLLTAIMFHTKLDVIRHSHKPGLDARYHEPVQYRGTWPPLTVKECLRSGSIARAIHNAHDLWLAVDYKQILEWSCAIINALPSSPASDDAVNIIANAALDLRSRSGSQHHDLVGITFCQSVTTQRVTDQCTRPFRRQRC